MEDAQLLFSQEIASEQTVQSVQSKQTLKTSSTGKVVAWNVHTLEKFPRYALRTKEDVVLCDPSVKQVTGYLDVDDDKHFYFWFFESRSNPKSDPLALWLNGGPGCSSLTGLLMELGPCRVDSGGQSTSVNNHTDGEGVSTSDDAAQDVYAFLQLFLTKYKKYSSLNFTVSGESYAGHYIPAIGHEIATQNSMIKSKKTDGVEINLESLAIGNGLTDPLVQYEYYPDMACDTKYGPVLPESTCNEMRKKYGTCKSLINACYQWKSPFSCVPGSFYCNSAMIQPFQKTGLNIYDIRKKCDPQVNPLCYEILNDIEEYLNLPEVQDALGVDVPYEGCKRDINMNFLLAGDWMHPYVEYVAPLLEEGVRVLIYAGDADYICNWIGNKAWVQELEWSGKDNFNKAKDVEWISEITGKPAGQFRMAGNLAFLRVYEAGHMVPYDQPEHSNEFFNVWLHGHKKK